MGPEDGSSTTVLGGGELSSAPACVCPSVLSGGTYAGKALEVVDVAEHLAALREQLFFDAGG